MLAALGMHPLAVDAKAALDDTTSTMYCIHGVAYGIYCSECGSIDSDSDDDDSDSDNTDDDDLEPKTDGLDSGDDDSNEESNNVGNTHTGTIRSKNGIIYTWSY